MICDTLENIQLSNTSSKTKCNLSKEEEKALIDLSNNDSIVIKEADKGGGVVIMNKTYYQQKILHILQDNEYYKSIREKIERKNIVKMKHLVNGPLSGNITNKEKDYLSNFDTRESLFYGLPKVHKSSEIMY
jgi:hypothetical protein